MFCRGKNDVANLMWQTSLLIRFPTKRRFATSGLPHQIFSAIENIFYCLEALTQRSQTVQEWRLSGVAVGGSVPRRKKKHKIAPQGPFWLGFFSTGNFPISAASGGGAATPNPCDSCTPGFTAARRCERCDHQGQDPCDSCTPGVRAAKQCERDDVEGRNLRDY